jgi:hypothetical protein
MAHMNNWIDNKMLVEQIITEKYVNAVGTSPTAMATKQKYVLQVWDMLQKSYASIGGIKGNGFDSPEEMMNLPMWKMGIRDGYLVAVLIYKDKGGRKSVAMGTDGTAAGRWFVNDMFGQEIKRSYGEKSKAALSMVMKLVPFDVLENYIVSPDRVAKMTPNEPVIPITYVEKADWPADALMTLNRYPKLIDYGYLREIGGQMTFKVMIGSPGKNIT